MREYYVHVEQYWTYKVTAASAEEAEQIVIDGDGPAGECTGYKTASVTATDDEFSDDLRLPLVCRGGCGKQLDPSGNDECTKCLLARLDAQAAARSVGAS